MIVRLEHEMTGPFCPNKIRGMEIEGFDPPEPESKPEPEPAPESDEDDE